MTFPTRAPLDLDGATAPDGGGRDAGGGVQAETQRPLTVIARATEVALGRVRDAKRQADALLVRRNAILDEQSTGYRRRSAHLPHLGDRVQTVAAEMAALRSSLSD
jgi:hypothetical protein